MFDFLKQLTDPQSILEYGGFWLLIFVIFAETGLLIGFFLPGDNLVFISGLLCATKPQVMHFSFPVVMLSMMLAAFLGNAFGYWFGKRAGTKLYQREDSFLFRKKHLESTRLFYEKHGGKTLLLGRFLPIIRTFAPILAGVIGVDLRKFMFFNVVGSVAWIGSIGGIAYYLGREFPQVEHYLGVIFISLIVLTALPILSTYLKNRKGNSTGS
jgi:membrane-associated protein